MSENTRIRNKVILISDMHDSHDDRIYWKEAISLIQAGYDVSHIYASDTEKHYETEEGIKIIGFKKRQYHKNKFLNKLLKLFLGDIFIKSTLEYLKSCHADFIHIHDIKLLNLIASAGKIDKKTIFIFEAGDPFFQNAIDYNQKGLINKLFGFLKSKQIIKLEKKQIQNIDCIITTEENMHKRYTLLGAKRTEILYNYTNLNSDFQNPSFEQRDIDILYTGLISVHRGVFEMIDAVEYVVKRRPKTKAVFIGFIHEESLRKKIYKRISEKKLTQNIFIVNAVSYIEISNYYLRCKIGLGVFQNIPTHNIILQIKIFEYMAFGIPIVGSNFGHINNYIKENNVGITVDPTDIAEIGISILKILEDKNVFNTFNKNGITAVKQKYNWKEMDTKLTSIYNSL